MNGNKIGSNKNISDYQLARLGHVALRLLGSLPLVLSVILSGAFATDASAACGSLANPNAGPFYIDGVVGDTGNPAVPCNNSGLAPGASKVTDPTGNAKELGPVNGNDTKVNVINIAAKPMLEFTNPNAQVDLSAIYTQSGVSGTDLWFYFGWARDANTGSGFIAVELERSGVPNGCSYSGADIDMVLPKSAGESALITACNPWSARDGDGQPGSSDLMILWDQNGGSKTIYIRYFDKATQTFTQAVALSATLAVAEYSPDGFRGEAAVNLTGVVGGNPTACLTFANVIPGTVTGNSDTADYKDAVLSAFPLVSNCGTLNVKKITKDTSGNIVTNLAGTFKYTVNRSGGGDIRFTATVPSGCIAPACVETVTTSSRTFTLGGQEQSHANLKVGTDYQLNEDTSPFGTSWQFVNITCAVGSTYPTPDSSTANPRQNIHVESSATTWCVITNVRLKTTPQESTDPSAKVFLFDSLEIHGIVETSPATRAVNVTFGLYTDSSCATRATGSGDVTVALSYGSPATTATANTLNTSGIQVFDFANNRYYWKVSYPGDSLNNAFFTCGAGAIGDLEHTNVTVTHGVN